MDATIRDVFTILNFLSSHGYKAQNGVQTPEGAVSLFLDLVSCVFEI